MKKGTPPASRDPPKGGINCGGKNNLTYDGNKSRHAGLEAKDTKEHKVKHKVTQRKSQRINFLSDIT